MKNIRRITNAIIAAGSCAVTHIPNCCMVKILNLFTLIKISAKRQAENQTANRNILAAAASEKNGFFTPGHFIENQREWGSVRFGRSTMSYSGCEIIAVYNILLDLGNEISSQNLAEIIGEFERKGAAIRGKWGCAPRSVYQYLVRKGYQAAMITRSDPDTINAIGESSRSVIITAYNDKNDIRNMIHTVAVTKDTLGNYILHNAYKRINGRYTAYSGNHPIKRLWDAIGAMSQGQAASICVIGIR